MNGLPNYFVQRKDGVLCAYWRLDVLRVDLKIQPHKDVAGIFKLISGGLTVQYAPISLNDLEKEMEAK